MMQHMRHHCRRAVYHAHASARLSQGLPGTDHGAAENACQGMLAERLQVMQGAAAAQWAFTMSAVRLLEECDPIHDWRKRMFSAYNGLAATAIGYPDSL